MNGYHASIFNSCAVVLNEIAYAFSDKALESKALISVSGTTLDISKDAHVEGIKRKFI
jgi:hypothetical protein